MRLSPSDINYLSQIAQQQQPAEISELLAAKSGELIGVKADLQGQAKIMEVSSTALPITHDPWMGWDWVG